MLVGLTDREILEHIARAVSYCPEEDEEDENYDENFCIDRETLLGVLSDVRWAVKQAGLKVPTA